MIGHLQFEFGAIYNYCCCGKALEADEMDCLYFRGHKLRAWLSMRDLQKVSTLLYFRRKWKEREGWG
jgi:hypothetical protein